MAIIVIYRQQPKRIRWELRSEAGQLILRSMRHFRNRTDCLTEVAWLRTAFAAASLEDRTDRPRD